MSELAADVFCQKIEAVCSRLGYRKRARRENKAHLRTAIPIR